METVRTIVDQFWNEVFDHIELKVINSYDEIIRHMKSCTNRECFHVGLVWEALRYYDKTILDKYENSKASYSIEDYVLKILVQEE